MSSQRTAGKNSTPPRDRDAAARRRATKQPGQGSSETDRPPSIHVISRQSGEERCWLVSHSDKASCQRIVAEAVPPDATSVSSEQYRR